MFTNLLRVEVLDSEKAAVLNTKANNAAIEAINLFYSKPSGLRPNSILFCAYKKVHGFCELGPVNRF
jgi:hypothetical protein